MRMCLAVKCFTSPSGVVSSTVWVSKTLPLPSYISTLAFARIFLYTPLRRRISLVWKHQQAQYIHDQAGLNSQIIMPKNIYYFKQHADQQPWAYHRACQHTHYKNVQNFGKIPPFAITLLSQAQSKWGKLNSLEQLAYLVSNEPLPAESDITMNIPPKFLCILLDCNHYKPKGK